MTGSFVSASMTTNLWWMYTSGGCLLPCSASGSSTGSFPVCLRTAVGLRREEDTDPGVADLHRIRPTGLFLGRLRRGIFFQQLIPLMEQLGERGRFPGVQQVGLAGQSLGRKVRRPGKDRHRLAALPP